MEGKITIIAEFTRKDEQPEGPVLPVCHATQVAGLDDANTAFVWMVGGAPPAEHYHVARLTVKDLRFLVTNGSGSTVDIKSDEVEGHQHTLTITLDDMTGRFIVIDITSGGTIAHTATLLGVGSLDNIKPEVTSGLQSQVAGAEYAQGEMTGGMPASSRPGMEFTDNTYSYRFQMGRVWGTYVWVRYLKAPDTGGMAA